MDLSIAGLQVCAELVSASTGYLELAHYHSGDTSSINPMATGASRQASQLTVAMSFIQPSSTIQGPVVWGLLF